MKLNLINLGILIIFIGILISIIGSLFSQDSKTKVAVAGFIGPIPFGFGNDKKLVIAAMVISVIIAVLFIVSNFWLR